MMRQALISAWQHGQFLYHDENEVWQSQLWQALNTTIKPLHRGDIWLSAIACLEEADAGELSDKLPERVSIFGINTMPPLFLAYFQALSRHMDVHIFLLNPVQAYWLDLPTKRLQLQLKEFSGHPLLIRLAQQGREFQQLLLEQVAFQFEPSSFEESFAENNLQVLQNDILANSLTCVALETDDSISVHACHSRLREVQVLKNLLLATLESNKAFGLSDILVMVPTIQHYAPYIHAVFADIQHTISDRSLETTHASFKALINFLELSQSRFAWQGVVDLLGQSLVAKRFDLNDNDLSLIRFWLADCQVRWGKDAVHKQSLGLLALKETTWQATLERLLMGYAIGSDEDFVDDILPYPNIEGTTSKALGGLNDFLQLLFSASVVFKAENTLSQWLVLLRQYSDALLSEEYSQEREIINEIFNKLAECASVHDHLVSLSVIIAWLKESLGEIKTSSGFLRGQLNFCSMLPMRSIPFQVIALLGMNDGEFPRIERSPRFDLLLKEPKLGDRSRRADDRYQFLETLLSARRQLIITYIGQSQRDNHEIPPSVVVSEMLDVLVESYGLNNLVIRHPLQAFSRQYFSGEQSGLFSYSATDYAIASSLQAKQAGNQGWWQGGLDVEPSEQINIDDLIRFFQHPQRFFLWQQLGVSLPSIELENEEREAFTLEPLRLYQIQQHWLAELLVDKQLTFAALQAQGSWPLGTPGKLAWQQQQRVIENFADILRSKTLGAKLPALPIDIRIGRYRLLGKLDFRYQQGCLLYRYAKLKGKDFMTAWLHHLLINCLEPQTTYLISKDDELVFLPTIADKNSLLNLIDIFLLGKTRPDVFFTEAAFCYLQQDNPETAANAVIKTLMEQVERGYEPEIGQLFAVTELSDLVTETFFGYCQHLLYPAWSASHGH